MEKKIITIGNVWVPLSQFRNKDICSEDQITIQGAGAVPFKLIHVFQATKGFYVCDFITEAHVAHGLKLVMPLLTKAESFSDTVNKLLSREEQEQCFFTVEPMTKAQIEFRNNPRKQKFIIAR